MKCISRNMKKTGLALLTALVIIGVAGVLYASSGGGHGEGGGSLSHEKIMDLVWRTMNFAALVIILVKFLSKPLGNALNSRRQGIMNQFEELNERREEVEKKYKEYEAKLSHIDDEVKTLLDSARANAEAEKERIIAEAQRTAEDLKRKAEMTIQQEMAMAQKQLRAEVADKAMVMAEEIIRKNLTADDQNKLVEDYLDRVGAIQ